ncbi:hypothetical protein ACFFRR_001421 [Megaselia abdita]
MSYDFNILYKPGKKKFQENEPVWIRFRKGDHWLPAVIKTVVSNRSYEVHTNNKYVKMHEDQIRKMNSNIQQPQTIDCSLDNIDEFQEEAIHIPEPPIDAPPEALIAARPIRNRRPPERLGY